MATQFVDVRSSLSALVPMLGGHDYARQWSTDIIARVDQLKVHGNDKHLIPETEQSLMEKIEKIRTTLMGRHSAELHSEKFFFSGFIPPFEQLATGLYWDNMFETRSSVFRKMATRYILERANRQQFVPGQTASDQSLLHHCANSINSIFALSPLCEHACRKLWELVYDQQATFWNPQIAPDRRKAATNIIGVTLIVLLDVAATHRINQAFYDLWIPTPNAILAELQTLSQPTRFNHPGLHFVSSTSVFHRHGIPPSSPQEDSPHRATNPLKRRRSSSAASHHPPSSSRDVVHSLSHSDGLVSQRKQALYRD